MQSDELEELKNTIKILKNRIDKLERENQEIQMDLNEVKAVAKANSYDLAFLQGKSLFDLV